MHVTLTKTVCLQSSSEENGGFSLNMLLAGEYQFKLQCPAGMLCVIVCTDIYKIHNRSVSVKCAVHLKTGFVLGCGAMTDAGGCIKVWEQPKIVGTPCIFLQPLMLANSIWLHRLISESSMADSH